MLRCPSDNQNYSGTWLLIVFQLCPTDCIITWYCSNTVFCFCHANLQLVYFPHRAYRRLLQKWLYNYLAIPLPNNLSLTMYLRRVFGGEDCGVNSHLMSVMCNPPMKPAESGQRCPRQREVFALKIQQNNCSIEKSKLPPSRSMASVVVLGLRGHNGLPGLLPYNCRCV